MDVETTSRMNLAKEEQGAKESTQRAKLAFLIGKSDEKVQALAVLMLHFCSGLQHIQDQEDIAMVTFHVCNSGSSGIYILSGSNFFIAHNKFSLFCREKLISDYWMKIWPSR